MTTPATTEADTDPVRAAILTAIDRLVEGTPQRSEGRLSVSQLAVEADVKRWHLTHQHTDVTGPRLLPAPQRPSSRAQYLPCRRPAHHHPRRDHPAVPGRPSQWCDRAALVGDPSDNIRGVRGVGPTTVARLLADGLHLEDLPDSGRLNGRIGDAILASWQQVLTWRSMARAIDTIELPTRPTGKPTLEIPRAAEVIELLELW